MRPQHECQGDMQHGGDSGKDFGKGNEEQDKRHNEPDMVGFPNWGEGMKNQFADPFTLGPTRQQGDNPTPKIRATGQHINDQCAKHE